MCVGQFVTGLCDRHKKNGRAICSLKQWPGRVSTAPRRMRLLEIDAQTDTVKARRPGDEGRQAEGRTSVTGINEVLLIGEV